MKTPIVIASRGMIIITLLVSLLPGSSNRRVSASPASVHIQPAIPIQAPGAQAPDTPPQIRQGKVQRPRSDPPPATETRQVDSKILGKPSASAGGEKPAPAVPDSLLKPPAQQTGPAGSGKPTLPRQRGSGWTTIVSEDFEGTFPSGLWQAYDNDGATNGEYYWGKTNYRSNSGAWSAWPARSGANGLDPTQYYYPNNVNSWMVYGPFDLSGATYADLVFYYSNQSEANYDYFGWYASTNGTNYYGTRVSGDSGGWVYQDFDLTAVPTLGNLTGHTQVWIALIFTSDVNNVNNVGYDGPFVDDIYLEKYVQATQPNLTPYTPDGWDFPIVPSATTGTTTVSTLYTEQSTYIDWAIANDGAATSAPFTTCLYYDSSQVQCWDYSDSVDQGNYLYLVDWALNLTPTAGAHTLKIVADVNNTISESDESDNTWSHSFTWQGPTQPNLTPFAPSGWDYPIVPSEKTGTTTVTTLHASQNTYVDWALVNEGTATSAAFSTCLYLDNSQLHCWNTTSTVQPRSHVTIQDWLLTPAPAVGVHTLKLVADVNNTISESNENDNTWEHTFTWIGASAPSQVFLPFQLDGFMVFFPGPWEVEPNNTYLEANGPLRSGQNYTGYPNDNKDYFSIYVATSGKIVIDLTNHTGKGVQLQLFYQTTDNRVAVDLNSPFHIEYTGAAGWYYIYIYTEKGFNSGKPYTLTVTYP